MSATPPPPPSSGPTATPGPGAPKARLVKGFRDLFPQDASLKREMIDTVRTVYERFGYMPLETPAVEYVDVLGKFLPESATPAGGIFAFRNPDLSASAPAEDPERWLSLRYDLTAPLARVAAQYAEIGRPFRRYQVGPVWRYEKPGPGRFREFTQFDFDAVGVPGIVADAEACAVICEAMTALGFARGDFVVKVNDRKVMQGVLESCGAGGDMNDPRAGAILRAIDKLDRLGEEGVTLLLGKGRKDESGDFTEGAGLTSQQIDVVLGYLRSGVGKTRAECLAGLESLVGGTPSGAAGVAELRTIDHALGVMGYGDDQVALDPAIIRGLAYYTGPVFEGVITKSTTDTDGQTRQFGSVYGGGRYDGLVERFTGVKVPATGASIGVDRMLEALKLMRGVRPAATSKVLVVVVEASRMDWYLTTAQALRKAGVNAEVYMGEGGMKAQMKYADRLGIPLALVAGGNELDRGMVQLKDLTVAAQPPAGSTISREEWRKGSHSQREVPVGTMVEEVRGMIAAKSGR